MSSNGIAQEEFIRVTREFEFKMNKAAENWLNQNYGRALDGFYDARDFLTSNMPVPSENYAWEWCRALKTYVIVLARLVEYDMYKSQNQEALSSRVMKQAVEWAQILELQAKDWIALKTNDPILTANREKWIKRFYAAIQRVKKKF